MLQVLAAIPAYRTNLLAVSIAAREDSRPSAEVQLVSQGASSSPAQAPPAQSVPVSLGGVVQPTISFVLHLGSLPDGYGTTLAQDAASMAVSLALAPQPASVSAEVAGVWHCTAALPLTHTLDTLRAFPVHQLCVLQTALGAPLSFCLVNVP